MSGGTGTVSPGYRSAGGCVWHRSCGIDAIATGEAMIAA
jgi:hypothetical protein